MNIRESGAVRKFRCCDAAKRMAHTASKECLTSCQCRPRVGLNNADLPINSRESNGLIQAIDRAQSRNKLRVGRLQDAHLACTPKWVMRDSHGEKIPIVNISSLLDGLHDRGRDAVGFAVQMWPAECGGAVPSRAQCQARAREACGDDYQDVMKIRNFACGSAWLATSRNSRGEFIATSCRARRRSFCRIRQCRWACPRTREGK